MGKTEAIIEICVFFILLFAYIKLCSHRNITKAGKIAELGSLYFVSLWAMVSNIKFSVWAVCVILIGAVKILTTKKVKVERRDKRLIN